MRRKIWKISKQTAIWAYRFFEAFVAFVLVVLSLAFWKLYTEPMDAKFMLPTLEEQLLPKNSGYTLKVRKATLSAEVKKEGLFHLEMRKLQLIRPDKTVAIDLPTVSMSYSLGHILTLNYMPDKLMIDRPDVHLVIDEQGRWRLQNASEQNTVPQTEPNKIKLMSVKEVLKNALSFSDIKITDGVLLVEDLALQQKISVPQFELHLKRRYGGLRHIADFKAVVQLADHLTDVQASATYGRVTKSLKLALGIKPLYMSRLGRFVPLLEGVDVPVSISAAADFEIRKKYDQFMDCLEKLKFQVKTLDSGTITLPDSIRTTYHLVSAEINGATTPELKTIKIAESNLKLKEGITATLEVVATGINQFMTTHNPKEIQTKVQAVVQGVPMAEVPKVWPSEQGASAHQWVVEHLSQGSVPKADFQLTFQGNELTDVFGNVQVQGATVDYLPDMPKITDTAAQVLIYPNKVEIQANQGKAGNVQVQQANLIFAPLTQEPTVLDIDLNLMGPVSEMLLAIDKKPLNLLKGIKFDWNKIKGDAETQVHLNFPLEEENLTQKMIVNVTARGQGLHLKSKNPDIELTNGQAEAWINNQGLNLAGSVDFKKQPIQVKWTQNFQAATGASATYEINGTLDTQTLTDMIPDVQGYLDGKVPVKVNLQQLAPQNDWQGTAEIDLDNTKIVLYPFAVTKEKGHKAALNISLSQAKTDFASGEMTFNFQGTQGSEALKTIGSIAWGKTWRLQLDEVKMPRNNLKGKIEQQDKTLIVAFQGQSWDLSELKEMPFLQKEVNPQKTPTILPPNILFENKIDKLILNKEKPMLNVILNGERKNNLWKYFQIEANAKEPFVIVYDPQKRFFEGQFTDLGALMSYLGVSDRFSGGKLQLMSTQDETGLIKGKIEVAGTELNETGFLLQAVSVLGIVDAIRGKNIIFDEIHIPFELTPEGTMTLEDAYAASSNIGITFKGMINLDILDLEGSVIPAYAVNSLPGKIPFIGALFREGEGGGLIGAKYSVTGRPAKPEVEFHPLSSMAPGALGYIF